MDEVSIFVPMTITVSREIFSMPSSRHSLAVQSRWGLVCDMRLAVRIRNKAASELIPDAYLRKAESIGNQLGAHGVYIASRIPSGRIMKVIPLNYNN